VVSEKGYGKCTPLTSFRDANRGGMGTIAFKVNEKTGSVVGIEAVTENCGLILINSEGVVIRIKVCDISVQGRYASGVKLINMDAGTTVVSIAKINEDDSSEDEIVDVEVIEE